MWEVLLVVLVLNCVCIWFRKGYESAWEGSLFGVGKIDMVAGIESPDTRDWDLTFCWDPLWYFTLQISLWSVYWSVIWNRDVEDGPNSCHAAGCYACGCTQECGSQVEVEVKDERPDGYDDGYSGDEEETEDVCMFCGVNKPCVTFNCPGRGE